MRYYLLTQSSVRELDSVTLDELFAMYFENIFRDCLGVPRRTHYNDLNVSKADDPRPYQRSLDVSIEKSGLMINSAPKPKAEKKVFISPRYF
ncbi:MAG: hypothetical protein ACQESK_04345 [Bacteroidota bacterium]